MPSSEAVMVCGRRQVEALQAHRSDTSILFRMLSLHYVTAAGRIRNRLSHGRGAAKWRPQALWLQTSDQSMTVQRRMRSRAGLSQSQRELGARLRDARRVPFRLARCILPEIPRGALEFPVGFQ